MEDEDVELVASVSVDAASDAGQAAEHPKETCCNCFSEVQGADLTKRMKFSKLPDIPVKQYPQPDIANTTNPMNK